MYTYPQYIHYPTTAPVQRYFADPHVPMNRYDFAGIINKGIGAIGSAIGGKSALGQQSNKVTGAIEGVLNNPKGLGSIFGGKGIGGGTILGAAGNAVGQLGYKGISGNLNSGVGAGINKVGSFAGNIIGKVNPLLGAGISAASGLIGGLTNRMFGVHFNDAAISAIEGDTNQMDNTRVADTSYDSIANQAAAQNWGGAFDMKTVGDHGWFSKGKIRNKYNDLMAGMNSARNYASANYANAANNVSQNQMSNLMINTAAMGGFFDNPWSYQSSRPGSGAIAYTMGQQQLANQTQMINQMQPQPFGVPQQQPFCFGGRLFASGGMLNDHGSDFSNSLMYIDEGGTHEENPYQGVPMGYDSQGTPNVVEEDEVIVPAKMLADGGSTEGVGDYVLSNRTYISPEFAEKYGLPEDTTHAEAAEILTSESRQNPTDIIAQNTDKAIMKELVQDQEQVKQEQQQRQMMQQQMMMQQMPPEQQAMLTQQEQFQGPAMEEMMAQQASGQAAPMQQMAAFGGRIYGGGGYFPQVNMFAGPFTQSMITRNKYRGDYTPEQVYTGMKMQEAWINQLRRMKEQGMSRQEMADAFNHWQDLYDAAISNPSEANIRALQEAAHPWVNSAFNNDEAFKNYFDMSTHTGNTPDHPHAGDNPWVDGELEGMTYLRNGGIGTLPDDVVAGLMYDVNDILGGAEYMLPEGKNTYRIQLRDDKPISDYDLIFDEAKGNGDVYTPQGDGSNPETDEGDQYDTGEYEDFKAIPTWFGDVPIWMSGIASLTDALGLTNKPDFTAYNELLNLARGNVGYMPVSYHPTGEQMKYMPYDPVMQNILNNTNTAASRRAIQDNVNGNGAMRNAALVALDRNANLANGQLGLQGRQYNDTQLGQALQFNNATNLQNAQGMLSADAQNAQNWRYQRSMFNTLMGEAIAERAAEKQRVDTARALNLKSFMDSLGNKAKENKYFNMVGSNPANGGYGMRDNGVVIRSNPRMRTTPYSYTQSTAAQTPVLATSPYVATQANNPYGLRFDLPMPLWMQQTNPYFRFGF